MKWIKEVKFKDLLSEFDLQADELKEIERVKPLWIERFNNIECLKHFVKDLEKVRTLNEFNNWLNKVYDYCNEHRIWTGFID